MCYWVMGILPLLKNLPLSRLDFFSALGWEAVFTSETFVTTNQITGPCYKRRIQQFEAVPVLLFVGIIQCSNQRDITVSGRLTKGRLWEMQTLAMHFGREFLFVVEKSVDKLNT